MVKVEYGDFYKFLASLGVTIIGATLLLSWLFLKEPFSWINQINQISNLDSKTQIILEQKQSLLLSFLNFFDYFIVISITIGLIFLILGLILWFKIQIEIDKSQILSNQKVEKELQNMMTLEIIQSVAEDIVDTSSIMNDSGQKYEPNNNATEEQVTQEDEYINQSKYHSSYISHNNYINVIKGYIEIEDLVYNKLSSAFKSNKVLRNQKIGSVEFDIIVQGNNSQQSDYIFEIKYFRGRTSTPKLNGALRHVLTSSEVYTNATNRSSVPIVLCIISKDNRVINKENFEDYKKYALTGLERVVSQTSVILVHEEELERVSSEELIKLLYLENLVNIA